MCNASISIESAATPDGIEVKEREPDADSPTPEISVVNDGSSLDVQEGAEVAMTQEGVASIQEDVKSPEDVGLAPEGVASPEAMGSREDVTSIASPEGVTSMTSPEGVNSAPVGVPSMQDGLVSKEAESVTLEPENSDEDYVTPTEEDGVDSEAGGGVVNYKRDREDYSEEEEEEVSGEEGGARDDVSVEEGSEVEPAVSSVEDEVGGSGGEEAGGDWQEEEGKEEKVTKSVSLSIL